MKNLYTRQVENLKRRLGQKWVSRWTENPKGRSRQKLGIKRNTMSHWITSHPEFGINYLAQDFGINQSASSSTRQQSDETLEDIKAIAELEPSGTFHIAVLFSFSKLYKLYVDRWRSLTSTSASCT